MLLVVEVSQKRDVQSVQLPDLGLRALLTTIFAEVRQDRKEVDAGYDSHVLD